MTDKEITMDEIAEVTLRWARHSAKNYPNWEVNELHNEAFLIAVHLIKAGRYKPELAALSTFLWRALPMDVRHKYRRHEGERRLTNKEGKRVFTKIIHPHIDLEGFAESDMDGTLTIINTDTTSEWLDARLSGYRPSDLRKRGMSYEKQKEAAEEFRNEQQKQRGKG